MVQETFKRPVLHVKTEFDVLQKPRTRSEQDKSGTVDQGSVFSYVTSFHEHKTVNAILFTQSDDASNVRHLIDYINEDIKSQTNYVLAKYTQYNQYYIIIIIILLFIILILLIFSDTQYY